MTDSKTFEKMMHTHDDFRESIKNKQTDWGEILWKQRLCGISRHRFLEPGVIKKDFYHNRWGNE